MDNDFLMSRLMIWVPLILSLSVHEWAHAWTAFMLGDDTAKHQGRLTLNPLAHIDPIGTVLLPLMGVPFGWAKPVPVNPARFRRDISMKNGMMITAVAGPLANICLAVVCTALFALVLTLPLAEGSVAILRLLQMAVFLNVILAAFNALPIPPLDGSRVADALMPREFRPLWESFCQLGPVALIAVILLPHLLGISILYYPLAATDYLLNQIVMLMS